MPPNRLSRRGLMAASGLTFAGAQAVSGRAQAQAIPEAPRMPDAKMLQPTRPSSGPDYNPVITLNGWSLPWRMKDGWKEFHLVTEPVVREFSPGMIANLWGYNGQSPGPTIQAVEGDKLRIFVTNKLPEHTTVHWHGMRLPNGMDGVGGLTQPHIKPGQTFVYEFEARRGGTFMYHPHADEMVQMAMGMYGSLVVHPRDGTQHRVDRDFMFLLSAFDIEPGARLPKVTTMTDFNLWTWNSRVFPGIDPLVVGLGDKVRIRIGNLTMTNHPIHLHGHEFEVTGTDGGWVRPEARWPEVTVDIPVGGMRDVEFIANEPGDWAFHCHKSHHTMNAMGHNVRTYIGVQKRDFANRMRRLVPDYMPMGDTGMAAMGDMEMELPANTLPMMTGFGQFGPLEMGGMFSVLKVREGLAANDYADPGPYKFPPGTVAYEWKGDTRAVPPPTSALQTNPQRGGVPLRAVRPNGGHGNH